jgi:cytochrome c-type biogenesis protein NrfE
VITGTSSDTVTGSRAGRTSVAPLRPDRLPTLLTAGIAAALWFLVVRLLAAFWRSDLTYEYVAGHSRRGAPFGYRLAAVWGGMEGSLLLFTAIVVTAGAIAARHRAGSERWVMPAFAAAVALATLWIASPFDRLDVPAVEGFGLTPILQHPAMLVHPPLLYVGLAATLPAYLGSPHARRWLAAAMGLLTLAMLLGAGWSYVEQGWGGYWAWDPVENASLATWMATLVSLHGAPGGVTRGGRRHVMLTRLPFVVALAGAAVARSGVAASVHSFAEAGDVGVTLALLALAAAIAAFVGLPARCTAERLDVWSATATVLSGAALAIVALLTAAPVLASSGGDGARIAGTYFARLLAPVAAVALVALATMAWRARRRVPPAGWVAHAGVLVLLVGVAGSSFSRAERVLIEPDSTRQVVGVTITNHGVAVTEDAGAGTSAVVADLTVNGERRAPSLVAHPARGGVLAETSLVSRPWRDVQVALVSADDAGRVVVVVRSKPLVQLVWIGAATVMVAAALSCRRRRTHRPEAASRPAEPAFATAAR